MSNNITDNPKFIELGEMGKDGTVGGDGAGQSWSRRFAAVEPDGGYTVVTVYAYPVDMRERFSDDEREVQWDVECMTETACYHAKKEYDDDSSEPFATDYDYTYPFDVALDPNTEEFAEECAQGFLKNRVAAWMYA